METDIKEKAPILLIIFSALSFIPVLGIVFGIVSIIIGLINFKRFKLILILGISGIALTVIIVLSNLFLWHHMEKSGKMDEMKIQTTEMFLNNIANELNNYKCQFGSYPDSLEQLSKINNMIQLVDIFRDNEKNNVVPRHRKYYYIINKDSFVLFSVGKDGNPFTNDDIHPFDKTIKPITK